jgi:hypothetical protein
MSGLVNGVLAGTGAFFEICNRFDFPNGELQQRDFFGGRFVERNRSNSHLGMVSAAFGILGRGLQDAGLALRRN